jgi:hypothetical protein
MVVFIKEFCQTYGVFVKDPSTRKAKSNLGRYRSLERRYFGGQLTLEEERRFEDLIYALRSLYKAAR